LIAAALSAESLPRLWRYATELGLMPLVEVHTERDLPMALNAGADTIGVNSRNLKTLEVDTGLCERMIAVMPGGVVAVAESGIRTPADVRRLRAAGFNAFLIGERFMTDADPGAALAALRAAAGRSDVA
jgi:indole-3-glycerol phosphate synthase